MTVNAIHGGNALALRSGGNLTNDSYSRNIKNQIANAEKQLKELSSNETMSVDEKMKRREELQQQISDLNMQLRQHQTELRRASASRSGQSQMDDFLGGSHKTGNQKSAGSGQTGINQSTMQAILSADGSMKQARVQGSVAMRMEGKAGVLKAEIKQDEALGDNTEKKKAEMASLEQKAQAATESQLMNLAEANRTMQEAAKAEQSEKKTGDKSGEKENSTKNSVHSGNQSESEINKVSEELTGPEQEAQAVNYPSVDIRL